jgi:hypothetical protein
MLKKVVANKLKDFLFNEREIAAVSFAWWLVAIFFDYPISKEEVKKLYSDYLNHTHKKYTA